MTRKKKPTTSLVRSSAAEYLTFVAASGTGGVRGDLRRRETCGLSQKMMSQLYDVEVPDHQLPPEDQVFEDSELEEDSVVRRFFE